MADEDVVWVPILPSLRGFASSLRSGTEREAQRAGENAGDAFAGGLERAEGQVRKAADKLAAAQDKVADATDKQRVAEIRLQELRDSGRASASQLAQAEANVERARRGEVAATRAATRAQNGLEDANRRVERATQEAGDAVREGGREVGAFGDDASAAVGKLQGFAAAAAGIGGAMAVGVAAIDNEAITNKLNASLGATGKLGEEYGALTGRLYRDAFGGSMEEVADAVGIVQTSFVTAGAEGEASLEKISQNALNFSQIFGTDVKESVQAASQLVTNGLAEDSTQAFDLMTASFQRVPAAMRDELPEILNEYGTNFRALGFTGEQAFSTLVSASQQGKFVLDKTGDALKEFTIRGTDMSKASVAAYDAIGLNASEMAADLVAGGDRAQNAMHMVAGGLLDIQDPVERANASIALFGTPLEDLSVDQIPSFLKGLTGAEDNMRGFEGAAAEAGETLNSGAGVAIDSLKRTIMGGFTDALGSMAKFLMDNSGAITSLAIAAAPLVVTLLAVVGGIKAWTIAQAALNLVMNANPLVRIISLIGLVVGALIYAYRESDQFRAIVQAAWQGIQQAALWAWDNVLKPVLGFFQEAVRQAGAVATWLWHNAISPAFSAIGKIFDLWWNYYAKPVLEAGWWAIQKLGDIAMWLWHNAIQPAFNGIGAVVSAVWNNVVSPVFDAMRTGVDLVGKAFDAAVGFVGQVWGRIQSIAAQPVKFVIESVYNNGIRAAWNKVAGWLGLDPLEEFKPDWLGAYAGGGTLPGYSPGRDNLRFVSTDGSAAIDLGGGESILRPEVAKAVGPGWVDGVNQAARQGTGAVRQYLGGFNGGGVVDSILAIAQERFPGLSATSTYRNTNDLHGAGKAVDLSNQSSGGPSTPLMQEAARFFYSNYGPRLAELIHWPLNGWQNIDEGQPFNFGEPTNSQHTDHLHVASHQPLGDGGGGFDLGSWVSSAVGSVTGFLRRRVADAFDAIMDPIGDSIPDFGGSMIGGLPRKAFDHVRGSVRDWLLGQADEREGASASTGNLTPGSGPVADQVREAMAAYGWDQGEQWAAVDWIIGKESSWNPTARNPSSGAFGLAQFLGTTKDQYLPDENPNPRVQGDAMARYIRDRYGDPLAAKRFWEENGWYDQGGLASGSGVMLKKILDPERVLDPAQTAAFEQLVPWLVDLGGMASGGFADIPGSAEFAGFLTQLPGQIFEETAKDTADFFGLGKVAELAFSAVESSSVPAPDAPAGTDTEPPAGGGGGDGRGPLVVIEQLVVDNVQEAANAIGREARRAVRSETLMDGW